MRIYINEREHNVTAGTTSYQARKKFKRDADIIILNSFVINEDTELSDGDRLILIKKDEMPSRDELENLLVARHTPGVHEKVKKACVGIAGLGGLGSNIAIFLTRLGIGKLILVDFDTVDPSNLNRQQYFIRHIGMKKTEAMKEILEEINPFVELECHCLKLTKENIPECFMEASIIAEAFDNPAAKAEIVNTVLTIMKDKTIVAASGMAGYFSNNIITTKRIKENFYLIGDGENAAKPGSGLMAPRVAIAAAHQANTVLRLILGEKDV